MKLFKIIRLVLIFYRSFLFASLLITACCVGLFWEYGMSIFAILFWFKVATIGLTYYFINSYKYNDYYYFQNLGVSKTLLWMATITFDLFLFVLLIFQTYRLK
jgi:hypothetical protein